MLAGDYMTIMDGPLHAEGFTWWKFRLEPPAEAEVEGWAAQDEDWYERAWGQ